MMRRFQLCLASAFLFSAAGGAGGWPALLDEQGAVVHLETLAGDARATVFVFVRTDCPISNRYAPELRRVGLEFAGRDVVFRLVYVDPDQKASAIADHRKKYDLSIPALRDPEHKLVALTGAKVTPEAAVFDASGELVYLGRIDDRYVDFGQSRPEPTRRDLEEALNEILAGLPVSTHRTKAIGCFIEDLK